jgi:hypothetical protein
MSKTWRGDEPGMAFKTGSPASTRALAYCLNLMATFSCFLLVSRGRFFDAAAHK